MLLVNEQLGEDSGIKIKARQEPDRGRMCGLGDTVSRRMLDPPLVLEVVISQELSEEDMTTLGLNLLCNVSITANVPDDQTHRDETISINKKELEIPSDQSFLIQSGLRSVPPRLGETYIPVLLGSRTINAIVLKDLDNKKKLFFVFADLACRIQGAFKLYGNIVDMYDSSD